MARGIALGLLLACALQLACASSNAGIPGFVTIKMGGGKPEPAAEAAPAPPAEAAAPDQLVYVQDFLIAKVKQALADLPQSIADSVSGKLHKAPASPVKELNVSCLHSVAPEPLGWKMWCPNKHAKVTQWVDDVGSTHRLIQLQPMPSMTAQMAVWFMTPTFPKTLTIHNQTFTKHYLWHPLDHKQKQEFKIAVYKGKPTLHSKLDETYRSPPGKKSGFRTEMWVAASDVGTNLPKNRYVLGLDILGFQAFTLIVEFNDSAEGLVVSVEVILGAAGKGYDKRNPGKGVRHPLASAANTLLLEAIMAPYRANGDFDAALNAVTRHVVEEFGNLPRFVPQAWATSAQGVVMDQLAVFKNNLIAKTSQIVGGRRRGAGDAGDEGAGEDAEGGGGGVSIGGVPAALVKAVAGLRF